MAPTSAFASVVKNPKSSCWPSSGFAFVPRLPCSTAQMPANTANGRSWPSANQVGVFRGFVSSPRQRFIAHIGLLTFGEHKENILAPESRICGGLATALPAPGIGVRDDLLRGAPLYGGRRRWAGSGGAD